MDSSDDCFSSERRTPTPAARPLLQQAVSVDQGKMHTGSGVNGQSRRVAWGASPVVSGMMIVLLHRAFDGCPQAGDTFLKWMGRSLDEKLATISCR